MKFSVRDHCLYHCLRLHTSAMWVGEKRIRKGEGMELDQLLLESSSQGDGSVNLQPFQLDILRDAFQITEINTSNSYAKRGIHLAASELKIRKEKRLHRKNKEMKKDLKIHKQNRKGSSILKENRDNGVLMRKFHPHQLMK